MSPVNRWDKNVPEIAQRAISGERESRSSTGIELTDNHDADRESTVPAPIVEEMQAGDPLIGTLVAERFEIQAVLGRGGMGAVYRALHVHMKKVVALKILHPLMSINPEMAARFEREAVAAGRLQHPGIVAATDFGRLSDGAFYLALEFVDGQSLSDVLKASGKLDEERALSIAYQMTAALSAAHQEGIVHRDLKPDNVMLIRTHDDEDFVKVLDFGIAKMRIEEEEQQGLTRAGLVFGTPEYMSPEQAMGHDADTRSDVYAVGMILYEMLAGHSPFRADDVTAMLTAQITQPPPPLAAVSTPLSALIFRLLDKDPDHRPRHASELSEELMEVMAQLTYRPPTPRTSAGTKLEIRRSTADHRDIRISFATGALKQVHNLSVHPVGIGTRKIPLWVPLFAMIAGGAIGAMTMWNRPAPVKEIPIAEVPQEIDPEGQLMIEVRSGDRDAVAELRKLTAAEEQKLVAAGEAAEPASVVKQVERYLALGRGYSVIKHSQAALGMYEQAVKLDAHSAEDMELLVDVRSALGAQDAVEDGLDFALEHLGSHGADLIYDVYFDNLGQPGMTPVVARAMRLVNGQELLAHATPALKVALRLKNAKVCAEYREIMPDAAQYADDRSLLKLRALRVRRGCGTYGSRDCFVCLRTEEVPLEAAIARAETNSSPTFLTPEERARESAAPAAQ